MFLSSKKQEICEGEITEFFKRRRGKEREHNQDNQTPDERGGQDPSLSGEDDYETASLPWP